MGEVTLIRPGDGEVIGDAPDRRVELLADHDALHATWTRFGPGRDGADPHVHRRHTDLFYVLAGELTVALGPERQRVTVPAGALVRVPPLVVHGFRNAGGAELRYLNLHAPGQGFAGYMRGLRDGETRPFDQDLPPADGGRPATDAVVGGDGPAAAAPGMRAVLLADAEAIAVADVRREPGAAPPPHRHSRHGESLYVLEGQLAVTAGDRRLHAPAGSWVHVPPGVVHAVAAGGARPARHLELHAPSCGFGAFLLALGGAGGDAEDAVARSAFDQQPER